MQNMTKESGKMTNISKTSHNNNQYEALVANFMPRPIQTEADYWATQAVIDRLLDQPTLSADEEAYLDILSLLIWQYDEAQETIPELRGVALLKGLMSEMGIKQKTLIPIFKHESTVSDVLHGRRKLTVAHIERLAAYFDLPHTVFFESNLSENGATHYPSLDIRTTHAVAEANEPYSTS